VLVIVAPQQRVERDRHEEKLRSVLDDHQQPLSALEPESEQGVASPIHVFEQLGVLTSPAALRMATFAPRPSARCRSMKGTATLNPGSNEIRAGERERSIVGMLVRRA
jgi:hypothetical protein